jgi:hypothetical protein
VKGHHVAAAVIAAILLCFASMWLLRGRLNPREQSTGDSPPQDQVTPGPIKLEMYWLGAVSLELRDEAPKTKFIADQAAWAKLWKTYRGDEPVPDVAFDRKLILVHVIGDTNQFFDIETDGPFVDERGDLKVRFWRTLIAIRNETRCSYILAQVNRQGFKSVNGHPVPKN